MIYKDYFLVFLTSKGNYCWRVISIKFFTPIPRVINKIVNKMEEEGHKNICLIKIKRI